MAEVIGLVASGISIAQIAGQVTRSIVKIKEFWDQVKAAPDDINHLLKEVDSFSLILQHIRDDLTQNALPELIFNNDGMQQSLELCRSGATELECLATELAGKLDFNNGLRRRIGAVKMALKQDDFKRLKRRLKNAIRLLSLAYQCHTSAMIRLQPDIIVARLSMTMAVSSSERVTKLEDITSAFSHTQIVQRSSSDSNNLVTRYYSYWATSPSWLKLLFGSLDYRRRDSRHRRRYYTLFQARYEFPEFFSKKVWDITWQRSLSDWSVNMRTYRTIPCNAPIIKAIRNGNIVLVQELLTAQLAFVTDRNEYGNSLLHLAAMGGMANICELLISEGAEVCVKSFCDLTPLECVLFYAPGPDPTLGVSNEKCIRLLVSAGAFDGLINVSNALASFRGEKHVFQYLLQQSYPPYYDLPRDERFFVAKSIASGLPYKAELIRMAITPRDITEEMLNYTDVYGSTFLHCVTGSLGQKCWYSLSPSLTYSSNCESGNYPGYEGIDNPNNPWRRLVKEMVMAGALLHAIDHNRLTVLGNIIDNIFSFMPYGRKRVFNKILEATSIWLTDLKEAGIDLVCYGAEEKALHLTQTVNYKFESFLFIHSEADYLELISFSYGPHPEDWKFYFSEPTDVFVGEFWAMIETVECQYELELPVRDLRLRSIFWYLVIPVVSYGLVWLFS